MARKSKIKERISRYWHAREHEAKKKLREREKVYDREVEKIYRETMEDIQKEIEAFYGKYAEEEGITLAEAKRRASKLDIDEYARKAKQYVAEHDLSPQANAEMKLYNLTMKVNRLELLKAKIGLRLVKGYDKLEKYFNVTLAEEAMKEYRRMAGILGDSILADVNARTVKASVMGSFHNATWSERIWTNQDLLKLELSKLLSRGLIQGKNPNVLARELRKTFNVSQYEAERLMRTELARVQTDAQMDSFVRAGFDRYLYIACGLKDVCEDCKALDGRDFAISDMEPGKNAPPMHPFCHCSTAPYEDEDEYEAWLSFLEHGGSTAEWNRYGKARWEKNRKK